MARGINRQRIYEDDADRRHWLGLLAEMTIQYRIRVHAYTLLDNHYHMRVDVARDRPAAGREGL